MKKGIIFDMDGTLWDSAEGVVKAWNEVIEPLPDKDHLVTLDEMYSLMGKPMDEIAALVFPNLEKERREEVMDVCCERENVYLAEKGGILYPKLEETLQALQKEYDLFIVSNCQVGYIEAFLEHYGFGHFFRDTENFGNTGKLKDENIRLVIERNGLKQAAYVGDTKGDYQSCIQAGVPFIYASYGFGDVKDPKYSIGQFADLPDVVHCVMKNLSSFDKQG